MSNSTISERYFEKLCVNRDIICERISTSGAKSPDYRVLIPPMELITEVKQLDPNKEDEKKMRGSARFGELHNLLVDMMRPVEYETNWPRVTAKLIGCLKESCLR